MPPRFEGNPAELMEALAAVEAERDEAKRVFETNIDRAENQWMAWEARAEAMRLAGTALANAAYNIKQGHPVDDRAMNSLAEAYIAWDRAASSPATSTTALEIRKKALGDAARVADNLAASAGDACGSRDVDHIMQCAAREDMAREVAAAIRSLSAEDVQK